MDHSTPESIVIGGIIEAENSESAIERLSDTPGIDLIVSDWNILVKNSCDLLVWEFTMKRI